MKVISLFAHIFLVPVFFLWVNFVLVRIFEIILRKIQDTFIISIYLFIPPIVLIYFYGFWAAYFRAITVFYLPKYTWVVVILCFSCIIFYWKGIKGQIEVYKDRGEKLPAMLFGFYGFVVIFFVIFLFTDEIYNDLFFGLPNYVANIWK